MSLGSGSANATYALKIGSRVEETGRLIRDGNAFILRRDAGGRLFLDLRRKSTSLVNKRVRLMGMIVEEGLVYVIAIEPEVTCD